MYSYKVENVQITVLSKARLDITLDLNRYLDGNLDKTIEEFDIGIGVRSLEEMVSSLQKSLLSLAEVDWITIQVTGEFAAKLSKMSWTPGGQK